MIKEHPQARSTAATPSRDGFAPTVPIMSTASSSCAIGRTLDEDGAVLGYTNLFVCDASAFPSIPDANTHLPTTMLAERLSARCLASAARTR